MQDGFLTVSVIDSATNRPIENATVNIYKNPESGERQTQIYQNLKTDNSGLVTGITLDAPDLQYSQQPSDVRPYSQYTVEVISEGYETAIIDGTQVFPTVEARQNVPLNTQTRNLRCLRLGDTLSGTARQQSHQRAQHDIKTKIAFTDKI